jgi:hypothetical protein
MKRVVNILSMIAAMVFLNACSPAALDSVSYIKWVESEDHELQVSKEIDGFSFSLQYKPVPYIILMENNGKFPGLTDFAKRREELGGMQYYTLRVSSDKDHDLLRAGIRDDNEYYSRLEYFTSIMQNDIELVDGDDTLACVLYHYERSYNLSPKSSFVLGFENNPERKNDGERTFIFHDQVFGIGTVKLSISEDNIISTPALTEAL